MSHENLEKRIEDMQAKLKAKEKQIQKMKCCENCVGNCWDKKPSIRHTKENNCRENNLNQWELF